MLNTDRQFRNLLIVESRQWWEGVSSMYSPDKDLVLTFDLGLQRDIAAMQGSAMYLDDLVDVDEMQKNNFLVYEFLRSWHFDGDGRDIFQYRGIPFGFSFRIEIWSDLLSYVLMRANIEKIRNCRYESLVTACSPSLIPKILQELGLAYKSVLPQTPGCGASYYFPIHKWMDEKVRSKTLRYVLTRWAAAGVGLFWDLIDRCGSVFVHPAKRIYFQVYHPTRSILDQLSKDPRIKLVFGHFPATNRLSRYFKERVIPIFGGANRYSEETASQLRRFHETRSARLVLASEADVTQSAYSIIEERLKTRIPEYLRDLDCIVSHIERHPVSLEVMIANIGRVDTLVDCVCKARQIPSYLIINGLMGPPFLDEGKYANVINGYSESIKNDYFRNMDNVVALGDPRMDAYALSDMKRTINRQKPTITIGASGYNNIDLNSYVAIEFEFLWDVLAAIQRAMDSGIDCSVNIKVRPNGYRDQYEAFTEEYFPGLVDQIFDVRPMPAVLEETDLYISIYSQTLFEASCMGIPTIFFKKDKEILGPPFDGKSELITAYSQDELFAAIGDFSRADSKFENFMNRAVMEKYVGPLDGKNTDRSLALIYGLVSMSRPGERA